MTICIAMLDDRTGKVVCGTDSAATEDGGDQYLVGPKKLMLSTDRFAVMYCGCFRSAQVIESVLDKILSAKKRLTRQFMIGMADDIESAVRARPDEGGKYPFQLIVAGAGEAYLIEDDLAVEQAPLWAIGSGSSNVVGMCELLKRHTKLTTSGIVRRVIESVCAHRSDCRLPAHIFEV